MQLKVSAIKAQGDGVAKLYNVIGDVVDLPSFDLFISQNDAELSRLSKETETLQWGNEPLVIKKDLGRSTYDVTTPDNEMIHIDLAKGEMKFQANEFTLNQVLLEVSLLNIHIPIYVITQVGLMSVANQDDLHILINTICIPNKPL